MALAIFSGDGGALLESVGAVFGFLTSLKEPVPRWSWLPFLAHIESLQDEL